MSEPNDPVERRATFLPMLMAVIAAVFFCVVMILVTGGFFFYVVGIGLLFLLLGMFHYLLWGRAMDQEASAERERLEALEKASQSRIKPTNWTYRR